MVDYTFLSDIGFLLAGFGLYYYLVGKGSLLYARLDKEGYKITTLLAVKKKK